METVQWTEQGLQMIDQTLLPEQYVVKDYPKAEDVWQGIKRLEVRGAPAIGIAGAFGLYLAMQNVQASRDEFEQELKIQAEYFKSCRPTAVNLAWSIERLCSKALAHLDQTEGDISACKQLLLKEAQGIHLEDKQLCAKIGEYGADLLPSQATVLTHCNAGALATGGSGTALAVIYEAQKQGKNLKVYADETRPLLQGARLTAWELSEAGVDVTVICDNMAAHVLRDKQVSAVIVGADRIASNGDVANKIGTYGLAILAKEHGVPFYVAAPFSTFDLSLKSGLEIPIEQREEAELRQGYSGKLTVAPKAKVYNPAFDMTPASLISAIITDKGVFKAPYDFSNARI